MAETAESAAAKEEKREEKGEDGVVVMSPHGEAGDAAQDEEDTIVEVDDAEWQGVLEGVKRCRVVKIGSREEANGSSHVSVRSSLLDDAHVLALCLAPMLKCDSLKHLDLSEIRLTEQGIRAIRQAILVTPSHVEYLALRHNRIGDLGARMLLVDETGDKLNFRGGSHLKTVDLSHNLVTDEGADALAAALPSEHTITLLDLSENHISPDAQSRLLAAAADSGRVIEVTASTTWKDRDICMRVCGSRACTAFF